MAQWSTTYSGLIALMQNYVEDTSTEYVSNILGIVNRAEERVLRDLDLTLFDETTPTFTANGVGTIARPPTIIRVRSLYFNASNKFAEQRGYEYVREYGGSGRPLYYHETQSTLILAPTPDAAYACELRSMGRPVPLSTGNESNWVAVNAADLLLMAALVESELFLIAPERVGEFNGAYAALLGPVRAQWRHVAATDYEPVAPAARIAQTR
jgi:hypothetical protein